MVPSFCASALLVLAVVVKGSKDAGNGALESLSKRASHISRGHLVKRAENGKLARRHGGFLGPNAVSTGGYGSGSYGNAGGMSDSLDLGGGGYGSGVADAGYGGAVGGGFGGIAGGAALSSSSFSETSFTQSSTTMLNSVMGGYSSLLARIRSYEEIIATETISTQIAMQQAQQLAMEFQAVINQFQSCTFCISTGIGQFRNVFSSLFSSFSSLVSRYQVVLPGSWNNIMGTAFGSLNTSFSNFFSICHSAGLGLGFLPRPMFGFFQSAGMLQVSQQLQQFGFSFK